jgi:predicted RNA-binding Zn ribbon-like protein
LALWASQAGLLSEPQMQQLLQEAAHRPEAAQVILERAVELREAIYRIFSSTAGGQSPAMVDLALLNSMLPKALGRLQITPSGAGFTWRWMMGEEISLDQILWPVLGSSASLLTSAQLDRVKICEDDRGCGFLFLDTSRNRSRRWCSMTGCGNRARVRRHRKRQRVTKAVFG